VKSQSGQALRVFHPVSDTPRIGLITRRSNSRVTRCARCLLLGGRLRSPQSAVQLAGFDSLGSHPASATEKTLGMPTYSRVFSRLEDSSGEFGLRLVRFGVEIGHRAVKKWLLENASSSASGTYDRSSGWICPYRSNEMTMLSTDVRRHVGAKGRAH
jgi:hypothetical protein